MKTRHAIQLTAVSLFLAAGPALLAQVTTGALSGKVLDAAGKPVAGARVALESPALFQTKVFTTDASGQYRGQLLPVGNYAIRVSAPGFLGKSAENVRIGLGANVAMDFSLKPIKETGTTVEVVASVAMEAKTDDKVSVNYSAEELLRLPTERSFDGAMALSPGVTGTGLNASIRGGSNSGATHNGNVGYNQVNYTIDGIDVKQDAGSQWDSNATNPKATLYDPLPDSIEDIQVVQSQLNARFGRSEGGAVNILTKSGGNTFEGTIRSYINRPSWTTNLPRGAVGGDLGSSEGNAAEGYSRYTDVTFSGPIIKDKLWFFFGTRIQPNSAQTARLGWGLGSRMERSFNGGATWTALDGDWQNYMNNPLTTWGAYPNVDNVLVGNVAYPTGFSKPNLATSDNNALIPANTTYKRYQGKLTGQVGENNSVSVTYLFSRNETGGVTGERTAPPNTTILSGFAGSTVEKTTAYTVNWNSTLSPNWFFEAKFAKAEVETADVAGPQTYPYFVQSTLGTDPTHGWIDELYSANDGQALNNGLPRTGYFGVFYTLRSSASITPNVVGNLHYSANFKTFQQWSGQHEIDFGAEFFQTEHQFGRERNGNFGVFEGGFIRDPSKSWYDASGFLFPTFYASSLSDPMVPTTDGIPNADQVQGSEVMRGPSAHIEQYNVTGSKARNNSTAFWVNDTWTINNYWNMMVGLRYNRFLVHDTNGRTQCANSIAEPRFQLKYDPAGKGEEYFTLTGAKLASRYSDDFASYFRSNGWTSRVVRSWNGAGYSQRHPNDAQPAVNGLTGTDLGRYGVRWVDYDELISEDNYNPVPKLVVALDQTMQTGGLEVPYALEFTLGYTRNYPDGYVKVNLVSRTYRKDWLAFVHKGVYDAADPGKYLTLVYNPITHLPFSYNQTQLFLNSELHRDYQDIEISWSQKLTKALTMGGNFTFAVEHGPVSADGLNYYNYRDEKLKTGLEEGTWAPTDALINRSRMLNLYFTWVIPVGKGNVSASILGKYYSAGQRSLAGSRNLNLSNPDATYNGLPVVAADGNVGQNLNQVLNLYYGGANAFSAGNDILSTDLKLQAQIPLAGRVTLVSEISVWNPFNRINRNSIYDWGSGNELGSDGIASVPIAGRPLSQFNRAWGYAGNSAYYDSGRTWSFNVGLKF